MTILEELCTLTPYLTPVPNWALGGQGDNAISTPDCLMRSSREPILHDSHPPNASRTPRAASVWSVLPYWPLVTSSPPHGVKIHPLVPRTRLAERPGRGVRDKSSGLRLCREYGQQERRRMEAGHPRWGWRGSSFQVIKLCSVAQRTL